MLQLKKTSFAFFKTALLVVLAGVSPRVTELVELFLWSWSVAAGGAEEAGRFW